jgi:thiamine pyrophosphokinase
MHTRAVIFANGELRDEKKIKAQLGVEDFLIAVDGGYQHLKILGLIPNLVIGDLDSMQKFDVNQLQDAGVEFLSFPPEKNETDLELALLEATDRDYRKILIVAGLGGRLDQTLGNLALLKSPVFESFHIKMDDGCMEVWNLMSSIYPEGLQILGEKGDGVSLLAFGSYGKKIFTEGLKYPLTGEDLLPYQTRGISNEMLGSIAMVSISEGELIVIHSRKGEKSNNILEV